MPGHGQGLQFDVKVVQKNQQDWMVMVVLNDLKICVLELPQGDRLIARLFLPQTDSDEILLRWADQVSRPPSTERTVDKKVVLIVQYQDTVEWKNW